MRLLIEWNADLLHTRERAAIQDLLEYTMRNHPALTPATIYVHVVDDAEMREINRSQRGIDCTTDVLSFPMHAYRSPGRPRGRLEVEPTNGRAMLGDLIISLPRAQAQAVEYGHSLERELGYLSVHGLLHLLGYDHESAAQAEEMRAQEERILSHYGLRRDGEIVGDDGQAQVPPQPLAGSVRDGDAQTGVPAVPGGNGQSGGSAATGGDGPNGIPSPLRQVSEERREDAHGDARDDARERATKPKAPPHAGAEPRTDAEMAEEYAAVPAQVRRPGLSIVGPGYAPPATERRGTVAEGGAPTAARDWAPQEKPKPQGESRPLFVKIVAGSASAASGVTTSGSAASEDATSGGAASGVASSGSAASEDATCGSAHDDQGEWFGPFNADGLFRPEEEAPLLGELTLEDHTSPGGAQAATTHPTAQTNPTAQAVAATPTAAGADPGNVLRLLPIHAPADNARHARADNLLSLTGVRTQDASLSEIVAPSFFPGAHITSFAPSDRTDAFDGGISPPLEPAELGEPQRIADGSAGETRDEAPNAIADTAPDATPDRIADATRNARTDPTQKATTDAIPDKPHQASAFTAGPAAFNSPAAFHSAAANAAPALDPATHAAPEMAHGPTPHAAPQAARDPAPHTDLDSAPGLECDAEPLRAFGEDDSPASPPPAPAASGPRPGALPRGISSLPPLEARAFNALKPDMGVQLALGVSARHIKKLVSMACVAMRSAHAPYSRYAVGAALLSSDGHVMPGCNVENASYGLTMCAERTAIGAALANGLKQFKLLVVVAEGSLPWPCGACRQVVNEFSPTLPILVADVRRGSIPDDPEGIAASYAYLHELLPNAFGPGNLS